MQTKHFKYIQEIVQCGSITKAAEKLWLSQQALSRIVDHMERELGFKIFERTNKGVRVTNKGEKFLTDIERMMAIMATWEQQREEKYKVRVLLQYVLSDLILDETFCSALTPAENIELEWEVLYPPEILKNIAAGNHGWGIFMASPQSEIYPKLKRMTASPEIKLEILGSEEVAEMYILVCHDDELAQKEKIELTDLTNKEFAINRVFLTSETSQRLSRATNAGTQVLPQVVHPIDYIIRNKNAFTCLPGFLAKNNVHVKKGAVVARRLAETLDEGLCCYLLYRTEQLVDMREIVKRVQSIL